MHISCTICTDVVEPDENIHATRCGHVFHNHCLSDWIERSNTCPQCRRVVTDNCMLRIYPTFSDEKDITSLQHRLQHALDLNKDLQTACVEKEEQLKKASDDLRKNEESLEIFMSELDSRNSTVEALTQRLATAEIQHMEVQQLKEDNVLLRTNVKALSGEIQRQNLLYDEFVAEISLQRSYLESQGKEAARLREENVALKKNLRTLNGELRRHKLLHAELRTQVSLQKENRNQELQGTKQKEVDVRLKKIENPRKMILNRASNAEPKRIEPQKSSLAYSFDMACFTEQMGVLSHKLNLVKSSHSKLSTTLVKLIVAWLKLKVMKVDERYLSESTNSTTSQYMYDDDLITRLFKIVSIDKSKRTENANIDENLRETQSKITTEIKSPASELVKTGSTTKIVSENDIQRISDFFTKLSERETQLENISKKDDKINSIISPIENLFKSGCQNDFQNAMQRILLSDTLKNYEKNFKSFNIGFSKIKKSMDGDKNNTGRSYAKQTENFKSFNSGVLKIKKSSDGVNDNTGCLYAKQNDIKKQTKEAFEFDATRIYGAHTVRRKSSVFMFAARRLPLPPPPPAPPAPPTPSELKKAAAKRSLSARAPPPPAIGMRRVLTPRTRKH